MSNFNSADIAAFKDVWVFCEQREGKLMPTDFELISKGRDLANELGVNLCGLLLGGEGIESAAKELGGYGADKVIVCESPLLATYTTDGYAKVICDVIEDLKPEAFLIGATNIGRDLGPRCAARLHTGLCADCTHLDVDVPNYIQFLRESSTLDVDSMKWDMEDRNLKMTRPAFGGHLMATIICPRFRPCMATVRPGVMKKNAFDEAKANAVEIVKPNFTLTAEDIHTDVTEVVKAAKKLVDLIGADFIVSVGRGISKDVPPSTPAGCLPTIRLVRPARPSIPRCTLLWVSPAPSSTRLACRIPSASSPSTRMTPLPSSRSLTMASAATCSRSLPC